MVVGSGASVHCTCPSTAAPRAGIAGRGSSRFPLSIGRVPRTNGAAGSDANAPAAHATGSLALAAPLDARRTRAWRHARAILHARIGCMAQASALPGAAAARVPLQSALLLAARTRQFASHESARRGLNNRVSMGHAWALMPCCGQLGIRRHFVHMIYVRAMLQQGERERIK